MPNVWTHRIWSVKPGHEDDFVAAWRERIPIRPRVGEMSAMLESFDTSTLDEVYPGD